MKLLVKTKSDAIYYGKKSKKGGYLVLKDCTWIRNSDYGNIHYDVNYIKTKNIDKTKKVSLDIDKYTYEELLEMMK